MVHLVRRGSILLSCIVLSVLLAVHALGSILARNSPSQAIAFVPYNGSVWERYALAQFEEYLRTEGSNDALAKAPLAASSARAAALEGIERDPLAPRAYALIAMSMSRPDEKGRLLTLASELNRRDTFLRALVMEQAAANDDYEKVVEALDQILRVRPNDRERFEPALLDALATAGAAPAFARLLDGSSPWHEGFLLSAANTPQVQPALASIRDELTVENAGIDRRLIMGLVNQGAMTEARRVYRIATQDESQATASRARLSWNAEFPPIDWELTDQDDFRAQPSRDERFLEVFARSGRGGVIARRLIDEKADISKFAVEVRASRQLEAQNLRVQLRCENSGNPFYESSLSKGLNPIPVPNNSNGC